MKLRTIGWSNPLTSIPPHKAQHHWLFYWAPALLWLALIAFFSTATFAAANTGTVLYRVLQALHIHLTGHRFMLLHGFIRKSAHFTVYGVLSALFFRAWRGAATRGRWKWTWALLALAVSLLAAASDEYHQSFTPGRTAAVSDVELDMMGATFAQLMIIACTARRPRPLR